MNQNKIKRIMAFVLAVLITLSLLPLKESFSRVSASASETDAEGSNEEDDKGYDTIDFDTNEIVDYDTNEITDFDTNEEEQQIDNSLEEDEKNKEKTESDQNDNEITDSIQNNGEDNEEETDEERTDEEETDEESGTFTVIYPGVNTTALDFSGCELLVVPKSENIFTDDTEIVSVINGVYLLRFEDEYTTRSAYTYYYDKSEIIEVNEAVKGCDKDDTQNDFQAELQSRDAYVALIDTGADYKSVVERVSVLEDGNIADDNGHGTNMAQAMTNINSGIRILSIKALDSSASGSISDIYEAIEYAVSKEVSIINLSISSIASAESEIIERAVEDARANGIIVVAAAGNRGASAYYYTPGNISDVITAGSCDKDGNRVITSNYGSYVDYYVVSEMTSVAASKLTGYISLYGLDGLEIVENKGVLFTRDYVEGEKESGALISVGDEESTEKESEAIQNEEILSEGANGEEKSDRKDSKDEENKISGKNSKEKDTKKDSSSKNQKNAGEIKGAAEGTISITNGEDGANYLTATKLSSGNYMYTMDTGHGTYYVYCLDPGLNNPNNEANYLFTQTSVQNATSYKRELTAVLWYGLHYSKTGIQSYNDCISSLGYYSSESDLYNQTHYTAAYAVGGNGYSASAYHARDTYNKMMSWISSADKDGDGKFYVGTDSSEGDSGSAAEDKFYAGKGYRVYFDYSGTAADNLHYTFASASDSNEDKDSNLKVKTTVTEASSSYGSGQITEWIRLIPQNSKPSSDVWANVSTRIPVPDGGTIVVDEDGNGTIDRTYTKGSAVIWGTSRFRIWIKDKTSKGLYSSGACSNSTIFASVWVASTSASGNQRLAYLFMPKWASMLNFYWGGYEPKERYLAIQKIDANTGEPINGVTFALQHNTGKDKYASSYNEGNVFTLGNDTLNGCATAITKTYTIDDKEYKGVALFKFVNIPEDITYNFRFLEVKAPSPYNSYDGNLSKSLTDYKIIKDDGSKILEFSTSGNDNTNRSTAIKKASAYQVMNAKDLCIRITKSSSDTEIIKGNDNYSLNGTVYSIYETKEDANAKKNPIHEFKLSDTKKTDTWVLPPKYIKTKSDRTYGKTTLYYRETKAGSGFKLNEAVNNLTVNPDNLKSNPAKISEVDEPVQVPVEFNIIKKDILSNESVSGIDASLAGAEFTVKYFKNNIKNPMTKSDLLKETPDKTYNLKTAWDKNINSYAASFKQTLPMGYIVVEEKSAPKNYRLSGYRSMLVSNGKEIDITGKEAFVLKTKGSATDGYFSDRTYWVENDGKASNNICADMTGSFIFKDAPVRADLHIKKVDKNGKILEGFKFKVKNITSNEEHFIYTDANGEYWSQASKNPRSLDTINRADKQDYVNGTNYPIWFECTENKNVKYDISNSYGSLSAGKYEVTEVRGGLNSDNKKYQLEPIIRFTVDEKNDGADITISYNGTETIVDNPAIGFGTMATCDNTGSHIMPAREDNSITDICSFTDLKADTEYTICGRLMVKDPETGAIFEYRQNAEGKVFTSDKQEGYENGLSKTATLSFKTDSKWSGSIYSIDTDEKMIFEKVDCTGLEGKEIIVYETLYLGKETDYIEKKDSQGNTVRVYKQYEDCEEEITFPIKHENPDDALQTIFIPRIRTSAKGSGGSKVEADKNTVITDTVSYKNLVAGEKYTVHGWLMDKKTGKEYLVDGKKVESYVTFEAAGKNDSTSENNSSEIVEGSVDVELRADMSTAADGTDVVVYEALYYVKRENDSEGKDKVILLAEHKDINDTDQTVTLHRKTTTEQTTTSTTEMTTEKTTEVTTEKTTEATTSTTETTTAATTEQKTVTENMTTETTENTTESTTQQMSTEVFSEKKENKKVKTGDDTVLFVAAVISLLSLGGCIALLGKKRRKNKS